MNNGLLKELTDISPGNIVIFNNDDKFNWVNELPISDFACFIWLKNRSN